MGGRGGRTGPATPGPCPWEPCKLDYRTPGGGGGRAWGAAPGQPGGAAPGRARRPGARSRKEEGGAHKKSVAPRGASRRPRRHLPPLVGLDTHLAPGGTLVDGGGHGGCGFFGEGGEGREKSSSKRANGEARWPRASPPSSLFFFALLRPLNSALPAPHPPPPTPTPPHALAHPRGRRRRRRRQPGDRRRGGARPAGAVHVARRVEALVRREIRRRLHAGRRRADGACRACRGSYAVARAWHRDWASTWAGWGANGRAGRARAGAGRLAVRFSMGGTETRGEAEGDRSRPPPPRPPFHAPAARLAPPPASRRRRRGWARHHPNASHP